MKKTAENTLAELTKKTQNENQNEIITAREKAENAFENGEYGKTIYIAQNLINYLKGKNPLTGLSALPAEGYPLIGIALAGVSWYGYRKWKEKKKPGIVVQSVPRNSETLTRPNALNDSDE